MTHREILQDAIEKLQQVYDTANRLRDHSTPAMQQEYNNVRRDLPSIWGYLQKIDNNLISDSMAHKEL
jgi:tRNA A58 N-methylase Trm61